MADGHASSLVLPGGNNPVQEKQTPVVPGGPFISRRMASWWSTIEDLQWPQKKIVDKIKRRAEGFAAANIDTAINYGFHIRFDFANYFGQLHGYYAQVKEELHQRGIRFMEHYSCNHVERPRGNAEWHTLQKSQRHHTLLFHDPVAAKYAQYEGYLFQSLCEVDIRDGSRGYAKQYQLETFCHNNPHFLDMHRKYLQRHQQEVGCDGFQVDDMCNYAGLTTCGCTWCRERFRKDYGHEIPPFGEKAFWGDVSKPMLQWGNYDNPVFRDWLKMKDDSITDHVKMVKETIGQKPLMTCCSSTGPVVLNAVSLNLERIAAQVDFYMLENVGTNIKCVHWVEKDAEALQQKDIARKRGHAPAIALSYTIYREGGYLGWALARFWGVANWASTFHQRLEEDPADAMEVEDLIQPINNWEINYSNLDCHEGQDLVEVRLANNSYCRANGWKGTDGKEHWDKVKAWSEQFVKHNIGYRFVRWEELASADALLAENTPLVIDSMACVSDRQYQALCTYLAKGGAAWLALPFGTHDEKGNRRNVPFSTGLLARQYKQLILVKTATSGPVLNNLLTTRKCTPAVVQTAGNSNWAIRARKHKDRTVFHFLNTALVGKPHPVIRDISNVPVLNGIEADTKDNRLVVEVNTRIIPVSSLTVVSPELAAQNRVVTVIKKSQQVVELHFDLSDIKIYAVAQ
ncbi:hypothetical protein [Paraflavitalea devenefica]|uniref:hypothetical protein n=1 Tax=Paraflavitalea devenefica TaxID=2716334 RepID=UPI001FEA2129|nr:hypothetical protein [Paraflavitalea devenefica]